MPVPPFARAAAATATLVLLVACGTDDEAAAPVGDDSSGRVVEVEMLDIAFSPTTLEGSAGETVRFVFTNTGDVVHEAYVGTADEQREHGDDMESMGGMDHGDDDTLVVEPGETGELTYTFDEPGEIQIGCHQPGHFEAGMVLDIVIR